MTDVSTDPATGQDEFAQSSPDDLVRALQAGDESAFVRIVQSWSPGLMRTAAALTGDRARAEMLVKATWLRLLREIATFRPPPGIRAWVCALMVGELGVAEDGAHPGRSRAPIVEPRRFRPPTDPEWPGHWALPPTPWPALDDARTHGRAVGSALRAALDELPQQQRMVVGLRDVAGCEVDEIGEMMGRPPAQVRDLLNRGRAQLRTRLEQHFATAQPA
jgi:RNA polymerase sigma-70 factor (ECF subfamily)